MENEKENQEKKVESEEEEEQMEQEEQEEEQELTSEEIKRLTEKVGEEESKYILKLSEWNRPGDSFVDYAKIKILEGRIQKVEISHTYNYPTTNQWDYIIIPLTKVVVLKYTQYDDYNGDEDERQTLYVFSADGGWKSLRL